MAKYVKSSTADQKLAARRFETERVSYDPEVAKRLRPFYEGKKYFVKMYGCQGNVRDSETIAGLFEAIGMTPCSEEKDADVAYINTCAVRENAEDKIFGEIGLYKQNHEKDRGFALILGGCAMSIEGNAEAIMDKYPWVKMVVSTHEVGKILELLEASAKERIVSVNSTLSEIYEGCPVRRLDEHKAFVNISYGCDKFCTYCIVPYARGRERSRKKEDILHECRELVRDGYKEITLLGQNVNSYGLDFGDGYLFADLLRDVAKTGIPRLRFLTSYPSVFNREMAEAMRDCPNICPALHFPVQSGSTTCLRRMGRRYTREEYLERLNEIKSIVPGIAISTDIIVAFPGETEEEFEDTLSMVREAGYASAFTFIYSPRPGTPAARMEQVDPKVAHERFDRLKEAVELSTEHYAATFVGKTVEVLVDGESKKDSSILSGYTREGKLVNFPGPAYLKGCLVDVKILESKVFHLRGELVEDPIVNKARDLRYLISLDPKVASALEVANNQEEINRLRDYDERIKQLQKEMALAMGKKEEHEKAKSKYLALLEEIANDPVAVNYIEDHAYLAGELQAVKEALIK